MKRVPPGVSDARTEKAHLQTHAETNPIDAPQIKRQDSNNKESVNKNQDESRYVMQLRLLKRMPIEIRHKSMFY